MRNGCFKQRVHSNSNVAAVFVYVRFSASRNKRKGDEGMMCCVVCMTHRCLVQLYGLGEGVGGGRIKRRCKRTHNEPIWRYCRRCTDMWYDDGTAFHSNQALSSNEQYNLKSIHLLDCIYQIQGNDSDGALFVVLDIGSNWRQLEASYCQNGYVHKK